MRIIKKIIFFVLVVSIAMPVFAGSPHTSYGIVEGAEVDNDCEWIFYVVSRPNETLSGYLANNGAIFFWQAVVGNLPTPWSTGESSMVITKKELNSGSLNRTAFYAVMNEDLSNEMPQQYNNCTLREIPIPTVSIVGSALEVSWSAAQTDPSETPHGNNIIGYNIYRSEDAISFVKINTALITGTTYIDNKNNSDPDPVPEANCIYAIEPVFRGNVPLGFYSARSEKVIYPPQSLEGDIVLDLDYNSQIGNIFWISLPYVNNFANASDIIAKINADHGLPADSGTPINQIGRWDAATQQYDTYDYLGAILGWSGSDFVPVTGEAIFLNIVADVDAVLPGTHDPNFAFNLIYNQNQGNINWVSLPRTSTYSNAISIIEDINTNAGLPIDSADVVSQIGRWDASTQQYETYDYLGAILGWSGTNFNFSTGEGYFINLANDINQWSPSTN